MVKEFTEQDQQIKTTLHNSLQEQKHFFRIVLKSGIIFSEEFRKIKATVQFKTKMLSFISDPTKNQFIRLMTQVASNY